MFKKYAEMGIDTKVLWDRIKSIIIKTCIATEPSMNDGLIRSELHRSNCFELFGFDVLVDDHLKPWLIEVNIHPSFSSSSPLDRRIKHTLICDVLNLIGIAPYDKKKLEDDRERKR